MERIRLVDGDTELLPGLELIETSGHVPGHQSVLVRLPKTGAIVLTVDAVPFSEGFTRDEQDDRSSPDAEATRASMIKLLWPPVFDGRRLIAAGFKPMLDSKEG